MKSSNRTKIKSIIKKCKNSAYFIDNYCKVKHPTAGVIPFRLFKYQQDNLRKFAQNRFVIYTKTRQCGISTLTGAHALQFAMFNNHKTVLIVSKRDKDAMEYLSRNIKFVFDHLPPWMQKIWKPTTNNEHELGFPNGSKITSLTSGPDTLRSNASSLNIIDEAAFIPYMDKMWSGGAPTLQHGGSVIVISTSNGMGNWYYETLTDAIEGKNKFLPITIEWWDMDWEIKFEDHNGNQKVICPTAGIRECTTEEERAKYGPFWSPWLEEQYRLLVSKGGEDLFRQEVLRDFIGSGNPVLPRDSLIYIKETVDENYKVMQSADYTNPINNENYHLNFGNQLWIWEQPKQNHVYSMGVDISSGEAGDYSAIEGFDLIDGKQVVELEISCEPRMLAVIVDYLGRYYNNAFVVPERTGMGITVCQDLIHLGYPNLFRTSMMPSNNNKVHMHTGPVGFNTTGTGRPLIIKALLDNLGRDGFVVKSVRLSKQLGTFVFKKGKAEAQGSGNDDLVLATGLALVGIEHAVAMCSGSVLLPLNGKMLEGTKGNTSIKMDSHMIVAFESKPNNTMDQTIDLEINKFASSLISPVTDSMIVKPKPNLFGKKK